MPAVYPLPSRPHDETSEPAAHPTREQDTKQPSHDQARPIIHVLKGKE